MTCQKRNYVFDRLYSVLEFHGLTRIAINHFKFRQLRRLAYPLSRVILKQPPPDFEPQQYDCLIPVPLPWSRKIHRGFNQTAAIAKHLAPAWSIPLLTNVLKRAEYVGLSVEQLSHMSLAGNRWLELL